LIYNVFYYFKVRFSDFFRCMCFLTEAYLKSKVQLSFHPVEQFSTYKIARKGKTPGVN
jgi:hypothetical protein